MLIFDSPAMEKTAKFDWKILQKLKITKPYLIAGSINIHNVDEILKYNPTGVDVSAGVESSLGVKSNEKIIEFLDKVKLRLEYKKENLSSISMIKTIYMLANLAVTMSLKRLKNPLKTLQNFLIN